MSDFCLIQELTLVRELMGVIERFNSDHNIISRPGAIRDTILAVAGLLHKEAMQTGNSPSDLKSLQDSFAARARERISDALQASPSDALRTLQ